MFTLWNPKVIPPRRSHFLWDRAHLTAVKLFHQGMAAVPLATATALGIPTFSVNSYSKASTIGPRGAT